MRNKAVLAALLLLGGCGSDAGDERRGPDAATALFQKGVASPIVDAAGAAIGTLTGRPGAKGLTLLAEVRGMTPGQHGVHLHEAGRCDPPDFASAGGHWNAQGREHGNDNRRGPHDGDLGNLDVGSDGSGRIDRIIPRYHGKIPDAGLALVIHAGRDDEVTDPSGISGARVACAVVLAPAV